MCETILYHHLILMVVAHRLARKVLCRGSAVKGVDGLLV